MGSPSFAGASGPRKLGLTLALLLSWPMAARAAPEEIQVYLDDKEDPGKTSVDWHLNRAVSARRTPDYAGEQAPGGVDRITPELNLGLTRNLEFGAYWLTTRAPGGSWKTDGGKLRLKYIADHEEERGMFWGVNLEVGREGRATAPSPWNAELKGIVGDYVGPWVLGANLNIDHAFSANGGPTTMDLDVKLGRKLAGDTSVGLESYNELGPVRHPSALNQGSKALYAVVDTTIAGVPVNAGIGRGLTSDADRWVMKFIVTFPTSR